MARQKVHTHIRIRVRKKDLKKGKCPLCGRK